MPDDTLSADAMLALANDYDAGVDIDSQPKEQSPNTNETAPVEQESSDAGNASKEVYGGEQEVGTKSEPEAKAEKKTEPKADKEKSKFAQEQNRKAKTWEQINAEKEAIKAEKEALKREREEWGKQREQSTAAETNSFRDEKGYTAEDYEAAAKEFEADGDSQLAKAARAKAEGVRKSASERQQKAQQEKFAKAWADSYNRLSEKETWLKDQNSPEYKRTVELLQRVPMLQSMPDGLVHAVELMKLQDAAGKAQSIEAENKALKEQLNKLQQKTAIGKSIPAGQPPKAEEKDFSKLSLKEQREALLKASRAFDREAD
jgi:hypothetical protein